MAQQRYRPQASADRLWLSGLIETFEQVSLDSPPCDPALLGAAQAHLARPGQSFAPFEETRLAS